MRNKKSKPITYLAPDDKMVGLGKFVKQGEAPIFVDFAIGFVIETSFDEDFPIFVDKLSVKETNLPYKVFERYERAKEALKTGELKYGETYCYSVHNVKDVFPQILKMYTKGEVMEYLLNYNKEKETCLNWTFMDEEEKEILRKKQNRKYIK